MPTWPSIQATASIAASASRSSSTWSGYGAVLEFNLAGDQGTDVFRRVLRRRDDFPVLQRVSGPGERTVLDMCGASDFRDYDQRARAWARAVWRAWDDHHPLILTELKAIL
jgi:Family of unknown function (DUF5946)